MTTPDSPTPATPATPPPLSPSRIELALSRLLRAGVVASVAVVLLGLAMTFSRHSNYFTDRSPATLESLITVHPDATHTLPQMIRGLEDYHGQSVVLLGLAILVATPILRVIVSAVAFALEKDRTYVLITLTVLALLVLAFALGITH